MACFVLNGLFVVLYVWLAPAKPVTRAPTYLGRTAAGWEAEIGHWDVLLHHWSNKFGHSRVWVRTDAPPVAGNRSTLPLFTGEPSTIPILTELLSSHDPKVRLVAAEGLERVGERVGRAPPALLRALEDPDEDVRRQAEQTLFRVARAEAERVGLEWTAWDGLVRRDR
jgi:hypothetical protein